MDVLKLTYWLPMHDPRDMVAASKRRKGKDGEKGNGKEEEEGSD